MSFLNRGGNVYGVGSGEDLNPPNGPQYTTQRQLIIKRTGQFLLAAGLFCAGGLGGLKFGLDYKAKKDQKAYDFWVTRNMVKPFDGDSLNLKVKKDQVLDFVNRNY